MWGPKTLLAGLSLVAALMAEPALAPAATRHTIRIAHRGSCCRAAAGTPVQVELAEPVSTRTKRAGDTFALRLAEPLVVSGQLLIREGAPGVGQVITSAKPGLGGKSAKLVLAAQYLKVGGRRIALQGLHLARSGRSNTTEANAVGLTGLVFAPLGFIGLAVRGGNVDFPEGLSATAELSTSVVLPSLGRATGRLPPQKTRPPKRISSTPPSTSRRRPPARVRWCSSARSRCCPWASGSRCERTARPSAN